MSTLLSWNQQNESNNLQSILKLVCLFSYFMHFDIHKIPNSTGLIFAWIGWTMYTSLNNTISRGLISISIAWFNKKLSINLVCL